MAREALPNPSWFADDSGTSAIEYAVIMAGVAVAMVGSVLLLGHNLRGSFQNAGTGMSSQQPTVSTGGGLFSKKLANAAAIQGVAFLGNGWGIQNNQLSSGANPRARGEQRALFPGTTAADSTIIADATFATGSSFGVFFRASGAVAQLNGNSFQYSPEAGGVFTVQKWINGVEIARPVASSAVPAGFARTDGPQPSSVTTRGTT